MSASRPVSAVIPNRDGADLLRLSLPPLLAELRSSEHEVLVVDDASEDDSREVLAREFPTVRVIALPESVGFGAACDRGVTETRHDIVLLLNSDTIVTPGSIDLLMTHFGDPLVFAVGPDYRSAKDADSPPKPSPVPNLAGAPAGGGLFRRELYLQLGGFDPLYYPFYWEDMDLGWAAWRAGWRIVHDTRAYFVHMESATIKRLYSRLYVARVRARNRCLYGWKNLQTPWMRRRHSYMLVRRVLVDLVRRRDPAGFLGLWDALRMRRALRAPRPQAPKVRSDAEIVREFGIRLDDLLRL